MNIFYTPRAQADIQDIHRWTTEHFGSQQAADYSTFLMDEIDALATGLRAGRRIPGHPHYFSFLV